MNRANRAIEILKRTPDGMLSCQLAKALNVDFAPRAICEAQKLGFRISSVWENHMNHREMRYFYAEKAPEYVLVDPLHEKEEARQEAFL